MEIMPLIALLGLALPVAVIFLVSKYTRLAARLETLEAHLLRLQQLVAELKNAKPAIPVEETIPAPIPPLPARTMRAQVRPILSRLPLAQTAAVPEPPEIAPPLEAPPVLEPSDFIAETQAQPEPIAQPPEPSALSTPPGRQLNLEQFLGAKLFAWIGGFALFLGIAFFVKYSFEHNLIPPWLRVALGAGTGLGLIAGGLLMRQKEYAVTSQTLCATGVVALYASFFAAHSLYHLIENVPSFLLMSLVTAAAFALAVHTEAQVVAILGLVAGFLTPPLLSTGEDNPGGLFGYIALLDIGLVAVAFRERWNFLTIMGAVGTALMEFAWVNKFFTPEKVYIGLAIFIAFNLLFMGAVALGEKLRRSSQQLDASLIIQCLAGIGFAFYLVKHFGKTPGYPFCMVLVSDLCLMGLSLLRQEARRIHFVSGAIVFLFIAVWVEFHFGESTFYWGLTAILVFSLLHTVTPLLLRRKLGLELDKKFIPFFGIGGLLLMLFCFFNLNEISFLVWPVVLLIDLVIIVLGALVSSIIAVLGAVILTLLLAGVWLFKIPTGTETIGPFLLILGAFSVLFYAASFWIEKKLFQEIENLSMANRISVSASSVLLPFLLLALAIIRFPALNPSPVFGLSLFLAALVYWLAARTGIGPLLFFGFGGALALEYLRHLSTPPPPQLGITWHLIFYIFFMAAPFLRFNAFLRDSSGWTVSALSGPLHFLLIYQTAQKLLPGFGAMGLIPGSMAIPAALCLWRVIRVQETPSGLRRTMLALYGGSFLFFVTLIFPIQFERQWITISWALEGLALIWLFHRVPHEGLKIVGFGLLSVAFARLALNPAVLSYYHRSNIPIWNWYLYSYGIVCIAILVAAKLLDPPRNIIQKTNVQPVLYTLGTILAFILLNIEIADFFGTSEYLEFDFSGNFARDMSYSIAWALFALTLLIIGIVKNVRPIRYASIALLSLTLLKLFFHDLSQLNQLYRIGAFIGVAIILIFASWLYQRFLARGPSR
jgi:uncharacterized membrane protein